MRKRPNPASETATEDRERSGAASNNMDDVVGEDEFEAEAEAVVAEIDGLEPVKPRTPKEFEDGGGDSMLARYFREMATHHVMGPEEELATAVEVEDAEIDHWVAIFSYVPAAEYTLDSLEKDLPTAEDEKLDLPQIAELRKLIKAFKKQRNKLTREQEKKWTAFTTALGRAIRLPDSDRLWIAHAEDMGRKLGDEPDPDDDSALTSINRSRQRGRARVERAAARAHLAAHRTVQAVLRSDDGGGISQQGGEEQVRQSQPAPGGVESPAATTAAAFP